MKNSQKEFLQNLVILISIVILAMNLGNLSLLFEPKLIASFFSDATNVFSKNVPLADDGNKLSIAETIKEPEEVNQPDEPYVKENSYIKIPKINIHVPLIFADSTEEGDLVDALDLGAVHYPGSVLPGQEGQTFILGHSAPPGWPQIKHDWIFSDVNNLEIGDEIIIYSNNRTYNYIVTGKEIIEQGQEVNVNSSVKSDNILSLISCWPPGKNYKRIAVNAELVID